MAFAKKIDKNQQEIVAKFRELGFSVCITSHIGQGFPDILVGKDNKHTILVEIKSSRTAKFTDAQMEFMRNWKGGPVIRIHDIEGVETVANMLK